MAGLPTANSNLGSGLYRAGVTNKDVAKKEKDQKLQNAKIDEIARKIEARMSQVSSPTNLFQQGLYTAFGNNPFTQTLTHAGGLVGDLLGGSEKEESPEENLLKEIKKAIEKTTEKIELVDETLLATKMITRRILDEVFFMSKNIKTITDFQGDDKKKKLAIENDKRDPLKLKNDPAPDILDPENTKMISGSRALGYTPFTMEGTSSENKKETDDEQSKKITYDMFIKKPENKPSFEDTSSISKQEDDFENKKYQEKLLESLKQRNQNQIQVVNNKKKEDSEQSGGFGLGDILGGAGLATGLGGMIKNALKGVGKLLTESIVVFSRGFGSILGKVLMGLVGLISEPIVLAVLAAAGISAAVYYGAKKIKQWSAEKDKKLEDEGIRLAPDDDPKALTIAAPTHSVATTSMSSSVASTMETKAFESFTPKSSPKNDFSPVMEKKGVELKDSVIKKEAQSVVFKKDSPRTSNQIFSTNNNVKNETVLPSRNNSKNSDNSFTGYLKRTFTN